jgi:purine nucleosidase
MAGQFFSGEKDIDWNSICDPLATAIAFRHRPQSRVHVGLDVTLQCRLDAASVRSRFRGPVLGLVAEMAEVWLATRSEVTFHDPLAAALVFRPDLCGLECGTVSVNTDGHTGFAAHGDGPDAVAARTSTPSSEYFSVFEV